MRRPSPSIDPIAACLLAVCLLVTGPAAAADDLKPDEVVAETARTFREEGHLVNFWWLPAEYWVASARELGKTEEEIVAIRALYSNYLMLAVLDLRIAPDGGVTPLNTAEIVRRLDIEVNGVETEVLREVDEKLQTMSPELSYILRSSLSTLGTGLRLLPLPNVDASGVTLFRADRRGTIRVRYRASTTSEATEFWWHAPLTAIAGPKRCPKSGAPMEASWTHCPWTGEKVD